MFLHLDVLSAVKGAPWLPDLEDGGGLLTPLSDTPGLPGESSLFVQLQRSSQSRILTYTLRACLTQLQELGTPQRVGPT